MAGISWQPYCSSREGYLVLRSDQQICSLWRFWGAKGPSRSYRKANLFGWGWVEKDILGGWDLTWPCSSCMYKFVPFKGLQKSLTHSFGWAPVLQLCAELLGAGLAAAMPHCRVSSHGNHFCSTLRSVAPIPSCLKRRKEFHMQFQQYFSVPVNCLSLLSIPWAPGSFEERCSDLP